MITQVKEKLTLFLANMPIETHKQINQKLCGTPIRMKEGHCVIELKTTKAMSVDKTGLIHGGFIFGAADYAAMLAVNHPNVVLGAATFNFKKPVIVGEKLYAEANISETKNGKKNVKVIVKKESLKSQAVIGEGNFTCFTPQHHILEEK